MRRSSFLRDYEQYRPVLGPALVLLVVLVLSLTLGRFLVGRLFETRQRITEVSGKNEILETKLSTLQGLSAGTLSQELEVAVRAIPSSDSTLFALATIRQLANERNLTINNLRVLATDPEGKKRPGQIRKVELRFDLQGGLAPTISFLDELRGSSPLAKVIKVRSTVSGASALTNLSVLSSWSPLPEDIGKVFSAVQTLSGEEQRLLSEMTGLRPPQGVEPVTPSAPQGRENPFAF